MEPGKEPARSTSDQTLSGLPPFLPLTPGQASCLPASPTPSQLQDRGSCPAPPSGSAQTPGCQPAEQVESSTCSHARTHMHTCSLCSMHIHGSF